MCFILHKTTMILMNFIDCEHPNGHSDPVIPKQLHSITCATALMVKVNESLYIDLSHQSLATSFHLKLSFSSR